MAGLRLSPRLAAIAAAVHPGETLADIGTDHGYLPLALWEGGICPHVILTDVSPGSLQKAEETGRRFFPGVSFDLRLGDGLSVLRRGEADVAVMAGMGGLLIRQILDAAPDTASAMRALILQPRNNIGPLRHWLYTHGFSMEKETLVREGNRICEVLTAVPKEVAVIRSMGPERIEYQYPRRLLTYRDPLLVPYLQGKLAEERRILADMRRGTDERAVLRAQRWRIEYLEDLLREAEAHAADDAPDRGAGQGPAGDARTWNVEPET